MNKLLGAIICSLCAGAVLAQAAPATPAATQKPAAQEAKPEAKATAKAQGQQQP